METEQKNHLDQFALKKDATQATPPILSYIWLAWALVSVGALVAMTQGVDAGLMGLAFVSNTLSTIFLHMFLRILLDIKASLAEIAKAAKDGRATCADKK